VLLFPVLLLPLLRLLFFCAARHRLPLALHPAPPRALPRRVAQDAPNATRGDEGSGRADHREGGVECGGRGVHGATV